MKRKKWRISQVLKVDNWAHERDSIWDFHFTIKKDCLPKSPLLNLFVDVGMQTLLIYLIVNTTFSDGFMARATNCLEPLSAANGILVAWVARKASMISEQFFLLIYM